MFDYNAAKADVLHEIKEHIAAGAQPVLPVGRGIIISDPANLALMNTAVVYRFNGKTKFMVTSAQLDMLAKQVGVTTLYDRNRAA